MRETWAGISFLLAGDLPERCTFVLGRSFCLYQLREAGSVEASECPLGKTTVILCLKCDSLLFVVFVFNEVFSKKIETKQKHIETNT